MGIANGVIVTLDARPGKRYVILNSGIGPDGRYYRVAELGAKLGVVPGSMENMLAGPRMTAVGILRADLQAIVALEESRSECAPERVEDDPAAVTVETEPVETVKESLTPELSGTYQGKAPVWFGEMLEDEPEDLTITEQEPDDA